MIDDHILYNSAWDILSREIRIIYSSLELSP